MILENNRFPDVCESLWQRLDAECEQAPEGLRDAYFAIADRIRERISADPALAERMKGKTVKGAYGEIQKAAQAKHKKNGGSCVCVSPGEAATVIDRYCFGESAAGNTGNAGSGSQSATVRTAEPKAQPAEPVKEEKSGIVDLFDLI